MVKKAIIVQFIFVGLALVFFTLGLQKLPNILIYTLIYGNLLYWSTSAIYYRINLAPKKAGESWLLQAGKFILPLLLTVPLVTLAGSALICLLFRFSLTQFMRNDYKPVLFTNLLLTTGWAIVEVSYQFLKEKLEVSIREKEEWKRLQMRSQFQALQAKLNPHFLFNTLNTMLGLVPRGSEKLERMIINLSGIYRNILRFSDQETVSLEEELGLVREYLEIEAMRLGDRLRYRIEADAPEADIRIPPLLIEPLVENAVIHGIDPLPEGGEIRISIRHQPPRLIIQVEDSGPGFRSGVPGNGFGLRSIRQRLRICDPRQSRLEIGKSQLGGAKLTLEVADGIQNPDR